MSIRKSIASAAFAVSAAAALVVSSVTFEAKADEVPDYLKGLSGTLHWNQSGGELEMGFTEAFVSEFEELTGVDVTYSSPCCNYAKLRVMVESDNVEWDMLEVGGEGDLRLISDQGLLQPLDLSSLDLSNVPEEFVNPYGILYGPAGAILIWNTTVWPEDGKHPTTLLDLYNLEDFPGKRCMFGGVPAYNGVLEYALLADGVALDELYPLDVERALAKLDTIKEHIIFWDSGAESVQFVLDGQCDLGTTWSGRPAMRMRDDPDAPLARTWKDAALVGGWLAITEGSGNPEAALALIQFYLRPEVQVAMCNSIAYCIAMPGVVDQIDEGMKPWVPIGDNFEQVGFVENGDYYYKNFDKLVERWNAWLVE